MAGCDARGIRHPLFGLYLVTAPFASEGGLLAESREARDALVSQARNLADDLDVQYLLIRTSEHELDRFALERRYVTALLDISGGDETV